MTNNAANLVPARLPSSRGVSRRPRRRPRADRGPRGRGLAKQHRALDDELGIAQRRTAQLELELERLRTDNARHVRRIQALQELHTSASGAARPTELDRGTKPVCPHCVKRGVESVLLRDAQLVPAVCPQCAAITLMRS
jgi:hypothetical protein